MLLLFIGVVVLITGFAINTPSLSASRFARPAKIVGLVLIVLGFLTSCIVQVNAGKVGVQSLFGKINNTTLNSGLNVVNPLVNMQYFDTQTQNYTMSAVHDEGEKEGDDAIHILTADGLDVAIDLTVLFRIIPEEAPRIARQIGVNYLDKIVRPITRTRIRDNAVSYEAVSLYSNRREEFQRRIFAQIEKDFKDRGLFLESVLIRNINLPESVKKTIESKINAEQDSQKMQFVLTKEKQEAERKRVEAQGIADYQRIVSSSLNDKQLQYEMIQAQKELAKSPNTKVIFMGNKGNAPIILGDK
jgi:regulator of protease activity HflC (stomatin/prohibitin superfamily)